MVNMKLIALCNVSLCCLVIITNILEEYVASIIFNADRFWVMVPTFWGNMFLPRSPLKMEAIHENGRTGINGLGNRELRRYRRRKG
jgi:hypothetical protein